ncbi:MAG: hypothetical protein SFT94_01405 [Pseudanabaenaceae cyanobacterium bins.68]|nr:hypothetical protein [Pseudanabaenaceae cyanobacterium bins.68]
MDELKPIFAQLTSQPIAFCGGLVSGLLRLDPSQAPLKDWLRSQNISATTSNVVGKATADKAPQSISID